MDRSQPVLASSSHRINELELGDYGSFRSCCVVWDQDSHKTPTNTKRVDESLLWLGQPSVLPSPALGSSASGQALAPASNDARGATTLKGIELAAKEER